MFFTTEGRDGMRKGGGSEWSACDNGWRIWYFFHFFSKDLNIRVALYPFSGKPRKKLAVNSQCAARRQGRGFSAFDEHGAEHPHFIFEHTRGAVGQVRTKGIRTNEFRQILRLMRSCLQGWAHFEESYS